MSFFKAGTERVVFRNLIILFSAFSPLGIIIGMITSGNKLVEAVFLAISTGTFIYVACSEVIVEEFAMSRYKYAKFAVFIFGGIFVGCLNVFEVYTGGE